MRSLILSLAACVLLSLPAPRAFATDQPITLSQGFNFIALHVQPAGPVSSTGLLETGKAFQVFRFDRGTQSFVYHLRLDNGSMFGTAFDLQPGEGYVLKSVGGTSVTVSGSDYAGDPLAGLVDGFNFVGLSAQHGQTARAALTANPGVRSLFRWKPDQSFGFVMRMPNGDLFGEDFTLERGKGYFVKKENIRYTLAITISPAGAGSVNQNPAPGGDNKHPAGTSVTLLAVPATGFRFVGWDGANAADLMDPLTQANNHLPLNGDRALTTKFEALPPDPTPSAPND